MASDNDSRDTSITGQGPGFRPSMGGFALYVDFQRLGYGDVLGERANPAIGAAVGWLAQGGCASDPQFRCQSQVFRLEVAARKLAAAYTVTRN